MYQRCRLRLGVTSYNLYRRRTCGTTTLSFIEAYGRILCSLISPISTCIRIEDLPKYNRSTINRKLKSFYKHI
ncbi:hypothetical protein HanXRQr2_Chr03g0089781 [Helianthus annuus]|uniref:Uncharacterized protein n=1 Tax=Helianthus annuus TaxID=4232 RepID=A0A9K3JDL1_HELAN|nr:hypothetical protein HanXRQr2_Chr03g0089781 [Helianthus annuus]KAJ0941958.1 hypothetical protein HanPSC8_Chr03g0086221 [Helianthus annuus]